MTLLILVVDDEDDVEALFRQQFRHDLRAGRFIMDFVQSAAAALERISDASDVSLILILSDINMPGMDGLALVRCVRDEALGGADLPIVMITTEGGLERVQEALAAGANDYLRKPFTSDQLHKKITPFVR